MALRDETRWSGVDARTMVVLYGIRLVSFFKVDGRWLVLLQLAYNSLLFCNKSHTKRRLGEIRLATPSAQLKIDSYQAQKENYRP